MDEKFLAGGAFQPASATNLIDEGKPILVGCCPSSGSTLLSVILDAHPDILCGPELSIFSHPFFWSEKGAKWKERAYQLVTVPRPEKKGPIWTFENGVSPYLAIDWNNLKWYGTDPDQVRALIQESAGPREFSRLFFTPVLAQHKKRIWAEKSPPNIYAISQFLEVYPEGRAIVIVRDGRDVVCSLLRRRFTFSEAVATWVLETALCLCLAEHPHVILVRYEDLVHDPMLTLQALLSRLNLSCGLDEMLAHHHCHRRVTESNELKVSRFWKNSPTKPISTTSVGCWRNELSQAQLLLFMNHRLGTRFPGMERWAGKSAADLLSALGYSYSPVQGLTGDIWRYLWEEGSILYSAKRPLRFHCSHVDLDLSSAVGGMTPTDFFALLVQCKGEAGVREKAEEAEKKVHDLEGKLGAMETRIKSLEKALEESKASIVEKDILIAQKSGWRGALREFFGKNKGATAAHSNAVQKLDKSIPWVGQPGGVGGGGRGA